MQMSIQQGTGARPPGVPTRAVPAPRVAARAVKLFSRATAQAITGTAALLLALLCLLAPFAAGAQTTVKSIEGRVLSSAAAPLAGSVVYLQDTRSNVIKTLIAPADGAYRFGQLPSDTDYQIWAEYKGKKSKVRLISSFDTKRDVTYDFHIGDK